MLDTENNVGIVEYKELKKANGDIFLEVKRMPDNSFITVNWVGLQSLETIVMGGNFILGMLREKPCHFLLNSNRELIGPWDAGVSWLVFRWAPQAFALGLRFFGHVLSPGIYGKRSFELFSKMYKSGFEVEAFTDEKSAEEWLRLKAF